MNKVGIFEAKTRLSELCAQVEETGMEFIITRRGKPVARLVASDLAGGKNPYQHLPITEALAKWEEARESTTKKEATDFPEVWRSRRGSRPDPLQE